MNASQKLVVTAIALLPWSVPAAWAGEAVTLDLPLPARLGVTERDTIAVVPFVAVNEEGQPSDESELQSELARYLRRTIERETGIKVVIADATLPSYDLATLRDTGEFWQSVGERTGATLILAGAMDFDLEDRAGYVTRELTSEGDGRTYYAQELIERTGVALDLLLWVFDAESGRLLHSDNLKDFRAFRSESVDPVTGLFANLTQLESRLVGVFARRSVRAERFLQ